MAKLLKIVGKGFLGLLEWVLILLFVLVLAIRSTKFQTFVAQKATSFLSEELQARVEIEKVDISFFDKVYLKGIFVEDHRADTLASIDVLEVNVGSILAQELIFNLDEVKLQKARVNLKTYQGEDHLNLQYIIDYFKSDKPASKTPAFVIAAHSLVLEDVDFSFIDENKELNPYGVDYDHMHFTNVQMQLSDLSYAPSGLVAKMDYLSTQEAFSGFKLDKLAGDVEHSERGIFFNNMEILTAETEIKAERMHLITYSYGNYLEFVDSVDFDVVLKGAKVSLKDVSMFAPELKGMTDVVYLDVEASEKVKNLNLKELYLQFGVSSYVAGDFILPDFRALDALEFNELIKDFYITLEDIENLNLPESTGDSRLSLPQQVLNFDYVNGTNVYFTGNADEFKVKAKNIRTALGVVHISRDLAFHYHPEDQAYFFGEFVDSTDYISVEDFELGQFLGQKDFGKTSASFAVSGHAESFSDIVFSSITGNVSRFEYREYPYQNITISKGSLVGNQVYAKLNMQDKYVQMDFDGDINFSDKEFMKFKMNMSGEHFEKLNLGLPDSIDFIGNLDVNIKDYTKQTINGTVKGRNICYQQGSESFDVDVLNITAARTPEMDKLSVESDYLDADFVGTFNFEEIPTNIEYQLAQVFPGLFIRKEKEEVEIKNDFTYDINVKQIQPILNVVLPQLEVAEATRIKGSFNANTESYDLSLKSPKIKYGRIFAEQIDVSQTFDNGLIIADYRMENGYLNDTLNCDDLYFLTFNLDGQLESQLSWNMSTANPTFLSWYTEIKSQEEMSFKVKTAYFTAREHRWDLRRNSTVKVKGDSLAIDQFRMSREDQYLELNGLVSNNPEHKLKIDIKNFDLSDFNGVFDESLELLGRVNVDGELATPFTDIFFDGSGEVTDLVINKEEVGDISVESNYIQATKKIRAKGKLNYKEVETFDFKGYYDLAKELDNLNFDLVFNGADLGVTNAFLDPDVVSNIEGKLVGNIKLTGELEKPKLEGKINLSDGNAKLQLLGANFKFRGDLEVVEDGIFLNNIPIQDEEGHTGGVVGQIFHDNFSDFNFDISIDMEEYFVNGRVIPVEKFLVMNTEYNEDEYYYGKAYVRGRANISGSADNLQIDVNAETRKGTWIDFPMYGATEIEEAEFIEWLPRVVDSTATDEPKIDFTGVEMNLNIAVTPEARLKVIFNEDIDDEITAYGSGDINIGLDNYNQLSMDGVFTVDRGTYNFAMGPYKQNFVLEKGGTVQWSGSPYEAALNIQTYNKIMANLDVVTQDVLSSGNSRKEEVYCYIYLTGDLMQPNIAFDIKAPKANELGKATLARIRSDQDELNKQFINLIAFRQFASSTTGGGGANAGLDLVSTQINSLIDKFNTGLDIGVALDDNSYELGFSKEFLDDKLIVSTSFGVENSTTAENTNTSNIIGDVKIEYILNEARTMRVNVYNESNDYTVIQDNSQGNYTQGVV